MNIELIGPNVKATEITAFAYSFPCLYDFSNEAEVFDFILGLKLVSRFFSLCCIELGSFFFSSEVGS